jgi:hypothetical protein
MRKLAAADPGWQADLVISLYKVSTASEPPRARAVLREALAIAETLAGEGKLSAAQQDGRNISAMRLPSCSRRQPTRNKSDYLRPRSRQQS